MYSFLRYVITLIAEKEEGGKGGSRHEFTRNNFAFHDSQNQYLHFHDS